MQVVVPNSFIKVAKIKSFAANYCVQRFCQNIYEWFYLLLAAAILWCLKLLWELEAWVLANVRYGIPSCLREEYLLIKLKPNFKIVKRNKYYAPGLTIDSSSSAGSLIVAPLIVSRICWKIPLLFNVDLSWTKSFETKVTD